MNARQFYAFSTELLKMAADLKEQPIDAGILELLADREGSGKYLPGGKLHSNTIEGEGQDYALKLGEDDSGAINISSGVYDLPARKKKNNRFQHARDYAAAGAKGAFIGLGSVEAHRKLKGLFDKPALPNEIKSLKNRFRTVAALGAGLTIAERAYRYHSPSKTDPVKHAMVAPAIGGGFKSPAMALRKGRQTGAFEAGKIHKPDVVGSLGTPRSF